MALESGMAAERGQSSQKLVYLRDHTPRPRARTARNTRRSATPPPADMVGEGVWLGRSLLVVAAGLVLYWVGVVGGPTRPSGDEAWLWASSHALSHLFLAGTAAYAARGLLRAETRAALLVGIVAGALIVLALEGISRAMSGGDVGDLSLSVRTNVLVQTATLAVGIWAASFAVRTERRAAASA